VIHALERFHGKTPVALEAIRGLVRHRRQLFRAAKWVLVGIAVIVLLGVSVWAIWRIPQVLYANVPDAKDRAAVEATTPTGLIAGLARLAALGSLAVSNRTYRLSQQGQLTDRYTKAIEQLGDDKLDIRLGGLYALDASPWTPNETTRPWSRCSALCERAHQFPKCSLANPHDEPIIRTKQTSPNPLPVMSKQRLPSLVAYPLEPA